MKRFYCAVALFLTALTANVGHANSITRAQAIKSRLYIKYFVYQLSQTERARVEAVANTSRSLPGKLSIVQFRAPLQANQRQFLEKSGAIFYRYIPDNAFIAYLPATLQNTLRSSPSVEHVIKFEPYFKLQRSVLPIYANRGRSSSVEQARTYFIMGLSPRLKMRAGQKIRTLGGRVGEMAWGSLSFAAKLTPEQLRHVADFDEITWIEPFTRIELDMNNAIIQGGTAALRKASKSVFSGRGIRGYVFEGIHANHPDFAANQFRKAPIALGGSAATGHGTNTYGQVFGSGAGNEKARGLLPDAQGFYTNFDGVFNTPGKRFDMTKVAIEKHGVMFQTASWGHPRTTEYTAHSAEMDHMIFHLDIPVTQSQSNSGTRASRPEAWAKNVISVGGHRHYDNPDPKDDKWGRTASIGPAADGRLKPDISAYYDKIFTTSSSNGYTPNFGGTSGATPLVAGHVGMILELWGTGWLGNRLRFRPHPRMHFANRPHATTVKALLLNGAVQFPFSGPQHDMTRVHQGWGFPNVFTLYNSRKRILIVNEDHVLKTGQRRTYQFPVKAAAPHLKVTMIFNEPAATVLAAKQLINDLTLVVTSPSGQKYFGNAGLNVQNYSAAGGSADHVNNVENVFVPKPEIGNWKVEVIAEQINMDAHLETKDVDADFALVARY